MFNRVVNFFYTLENKIHGTLSRAPVLYALIGAVGVILMWKGVEETAGLFPFLFGPISFVLGALILLLTGLLVSFFAGESIILSGFTKEKKLAEKTESEVRSEITTMEHVAVKLDAVEAHLEDIEKQLDKKVP